MRAIGTAEHQRRANDGGKDKTADPDPAGSLGSGLGRGRPGGRCLGGFRRCGGRGRTGLVLVGGRRGGRSRGGRGRGPSGCGPGTRTRPAGLRPARGCTAR
ncbi:MAG: hypothetical protein CML67_09775 [Rhodobacteraceae bacterium]|nr:hypothetical protein [Paracoccaceae bacterium]